MAGVTLYDYQLDAINRMKIGCILCGGVGSGKSRTSLAFYYEKRYALAAFYTLFFWSVVPFFLCVTDLLIALPMQADENGDILI